MSDLGFECNEVRFLNTRCGVQIFELAVEVRAKRTYLGVECLLGFLDALLFLHDCTSCFCLFCPRFFEGFVMSSLFSAKALEVFVLFDNCLRVGRYRLFGVEQFE